MINSTQDAAVQYIKASQFNPEEICSIHPDVFFTPIMNFLASQGTEVLNFYKGMSFMGRPFSPAKSRLYYLMHPIHAAREMKSSASSNLWKKYVLGRFVAVYSVLIPVAKTLYRKFAVLKSWCRYYLYAERISRAYDLAASCSVISFDVFDTLVFRKCKTYQVFDTAEEKSGLARAYNIKSFRTMRINAQACAAKNSINEEITLDDIYDEIANEFGLDFAEDMKNAELEAEIEAVYPNAEMQNFYNAMKAAGKRIIIASDMYLPGKVIAGILEKCGYDGYESIYVSSECRARKSSGALFRKIVSDKGVLPSEILHIGDNLHSDYLMANREGLRGFLYKK